MWRYVYGVCVPVCAGSPMSTPVEAREKCWCLPQSLPTLGFKIGSLTNPEAMDGALRSLFSTPCHWNYKHMQPFSGAGDLDVGSSSFHSKHYYPLRPLPSTNLNFCSLINNLLLSQ